MVLTPEIINIELSEEEHPESFIRARLSYDTVKSKMANVVFEAQNNRSAIL